MDEPDRAEPGHPVPDHPAPSRRSWSVVTVALTVTVALVIVVSIGVLTLGPQPTGEDGWLTRILERMTGDRGIDLASNHLLEFAANIALFVPVGIVLIVILGRRRWWLALLVALAFAVSIELVQQVLAGRFSSPRDVLANTAGAAGGILLASLVGLLLDGRSRRRARASGA